jgi:hypothetical protein
MVALLQIEIITNLPVRSTIENASRSGTATGKHREQQKGGDDRDYAHRDGFPQTGAL